jgi:hypothetical protein
MSDLPIPENPASSSRGALSNPPNRFEPLQIEPDPDWYEEEERLPQTRFFRDHSISILTTNDSPDVGFDVRGEGIQAEQIRRLFDVACRRAGLDRGFPELSTAAFRRPAGRQLELFG